MIRMKLLPIFLSMCFIATLTLAGIDDHLIYDNAKRHTLTGLDALVELEIVHYYAFSEPYILYNYLNEMNRFNSRGEDEKEPSGYGSYYWFPEPYLNAYMMLFRHSTWVIDARVKSCLYGKCETKWIRCAMQYTRAFGPREHPKNVCVRDEGVDRILLGLTWIDKDEFLLGFRDKLCFLTDDLDFMTPRKRDSMLGNGHFKNYEDTMMQSRLGSSGDDHLSPTDVTYCVIRDLNIHKSIYVEDIIEKDLANVRGYSMLDEGPLLKALNNALSEEDL